MEFSIFSKARFKKAASVFESCGNGVPSNVLLPTCPARSIKIIFPKKNMTHATKTNDAARWFVQFIRSNNYVCEKM